MANNLTTIASEIQRIKTNIANAYTALSDAGATLPATQNSDNLVTCVESVSSGLNVTSYNTYIGCGLTVTDNIVSGFDGSISEISGGLTYSYPRNVWSAKPFYPQQNLWSIHTKFKLNSLNTSLQNLISNRHTETKSTPWIGIYNTGYLTMYLSSSSTLNGIASDVQSNVALSINTWYWLKLSYELNSSTSTNHYVVYLSTDGTTYTPVITVENSTKIGQGTNNGYISFGTSINSQTTPKPYLEGSIDLKETYVVVAGVKDWEAIPSN